METLLYTSLNKLYLSKFKFSFKIIPPYCKKNKNKNKQTKTKNKLLEKERWIKMSNELITFSPQSQPFDGRVLYHKSRLTDQRDVVALGNLSHPRDLMLEALVRTANSWRWAHLHLHPSMHHLGPGRLQRLLNVDLSKRSGPECYYSLSKSCDYYEQKQTRRDSCSSAVSRHSEGKIGRSHSDGQEYPTFRGHKIRTWKLHDSSCSFTDRLWCSILWLCTEDPTITVLA